MENNLIIRHMTKDDVDAVYKVEENCFTDPWSKDSIRKELKNDLKSLIKNLIPLNVVLFGLGLMIRILGLFDNVSIIAIVCGLMIKLLVM